jgi:hypothetical protein
MEEKIIIAMNPGGISNRVKCIISMLKLGDLYKRKFYLNWVKNHTCGADFSDLFENDFSEIKKDSLDKINKENVEFYGGDASEINDSSKNYIISDTWRFVLPKGELQNNFAIQFPTGKGNNIDFEFERIPLETRNKIIPYLKKLRPIKKIRNVVENFSKENNLKNAVGIHIRRDDFMHGKEGLGKVSTDDKFIEKINEILNKKPDTKFLLCTDCQDAENKFVKLFKEKIIIFPKKNRDRTSVEATQEGLVDLLLLSKTKHIIGTYRSTFNELAWWFGDCKAKIDIVKDKDMKKEYETKKKMYDKSIFLKFKKYVAKLLGRTSPFR